MIPVEHTTGRAAFMARTKGGAGKSGVRTWSWCGQQRRVSQASQVVVSDFVMGVMLAFLPSRRNRESDWLWTPAR